MTSENIALQFRSIVETPILDEKKWAKVPDLRCDAIIVDLEDSAPVNRKLEARAKAVEFLGRPEYFRGKAVLARANPVDTPWGHDDLVAFAEAGVENLLSPKLQCADDLRGVQALVRQHGADPRLFAIVETARAYLNMESIAAVENVAAVMFGTGDLSVETGISVFDVDGTLNRALLYPAAKASMVASAYGAACFAAAWAPDIRDLTAIRAALEQYHRCGYTGMVTFYPPHLEVINDIFRPSEDEVRQAGRVVEVYEAALADGRGAVMMPGGVAVTIMEYKKAKTLLSKVSESSDN